MRIIKRFKNTFNILQTLCSGTPDSLLILYPHTEVIQPGVAVIHREKSDEAYDDLKILEQKNNRNIK